MSSSEDFRSDSNEDEASDFHQRATHDADSSRSDLGELRSGLSGGRIDVRHRRLKRSNDDGSISRSKSRVKRLKTLYNDEYRELYNEAIRHLGPKSKPENLRHLKELQIGISVWSAEEKARFFSSLARHGRHDVRGIAVAVGSKSEPEVCGFLKLLHEGAIEREFRTIHPKNMFNICDIEGSIEVQPSCESALEGAADALIMLQDREEEKAAKYADPNYWLLTPWIAKWADRALKTGGEAEQEVLERMPATELLDLKAFLRLSKRLIMNSSDPSRNWRNFEERRAPSFRHSAFQDFHALTLAFTKRLVQLVVTLADSRIRAETNKSSNPTKLVRREDVLASVDILGIAAKSCKTWINMPRKCNFGVFDDSSHEKGQTRMILQHDELEKDWLPTTPEEAIDQGREVCPEEGPKTDQIQQRRLQQELLRQRRYQQKPLPKAQRPTRHSGKSSVNGGQQSIFSQDSESPSSTGDEDEITKQEEHELLQDGYMEILDRRASRAEEIKLWHMLGEDAATKMSPNEIELPKKALPPSRTREDLGDWTDWLDYAAEWETMDGPVTNKVFDAQRSAWDEKKRVKVAKGLPRVERRSEEGAREDSKYPDDDKDIEDHDSFAGEQINETREVTDPSPSGGSSEDEMNQQE